MIKYFKTAWQQIGKNYSAGRICSERHLQAELFHILYSNNEFLDNYELRVEPCLYQSCGTPSKYGMTGFVPDMLVVSGLKIVACLELKYVPHGFVKFQKDISNLINFWDLKSQTDLNLYLNTLPQSGDWNYEQPYTISPDFQLIYAIIGNENSDCIENHRDIWARSGSAKIRYNQFVGSISKDKEPAFYMIEVTLPPTSF
jgi:hypothetical protein